MILVIYSNAFEQVLINSPAVTIWTLNITPAKYFVHITSYFSQVYVVGIYDSCFMDKETEAKRDNKSMYILRSYYRI